MKTLRRFGPALVLGLTIALTAVTFAQSANQVTRDQKHSCCCVTSGCCGDSCQMMNKIGMKNHATSGDKEGCCCCGDSCQMKKEEVKNHATSSAKGSCCCGNSGETKAGAAKTTVGANMSSHKHDGCCCGDSVVMKDGAAKTSVAPNSSPHKHECCCGGDSCKMKETKDMKEQP